uniref:Uncharacterized protein n=1 Tax=Lutzomyia longipalpis TaxID=7200 RepID=A0A1B0CMP8_LUTLO
MGAGEVVAEENPPDPLDGLNYLGEINETSTEAYIVYPGPDDVSISRPSEGIYQQSVTLTARMWPPVEAGPQRTVWGLPAVVWGVVIGCTVVGVLVVATLFFCCWLLPRSRKFLSPSRCGAAVTTTSGEAGGGIIMAHHNSHNSQPWTGVPPQYTAPAPPVSHSAATQGHHASNSKAHTSRNLMPGNFCNLVPCQSTIPETHKSMWAINPLYTSSSVLSESEESSYRTRSLPSWGKGAKQRPVSTTDDLEELYAKVNFSKKRRNRMRNDEAAIIALCRSRSQNLAVLPLERDGIVVYDERTALYSRWDLNSSFILSGHRKSAFIPYRPTNTVLTNLQRGNTETDSSEISLNFHEKAAQGEITEEMVKEQALVDAVDQYEFTALHWACYYGQLSSHKADINHTDIVGNTALMYAAGGNHPHTCNELIAFHPDLTESNENGDTAYSLAIRNKASLAQTVLENHIFSYFLK